MSPIKTSYHWAVGKAYKYVINGVISVSLIDVDRYNVRCIWIISYENHKDKINE